MPKSQSWCWKSANIAVNTTVYYQPTTPVLPESLCSMIPYCLGLFYEGFCRSCYSHIASAGDCWLLLCLLSVYLQFSKIRIAQPFHGLCVTFFQLAYQPPGPTQYYLIFLSGLKPNGPNIIRFNDNRLTFGLCVFQYVRQKPGERPVSVEWAY